MFVDQRNLVSSHRNRGRARGREDEWETDKHNIISDICFISMSIKVDFRLRFLNREI